jgi:hypothetical protein
MAVGQITKDFPRTDRLSDSFPQPVGPGFTRSNPTSPFSGAVNQGTNVVTANVDTSSPGADPNAGDSTANSFTIKLTPFGGSAGEAFLFVGSGSWSFNVPAVNMTATITRPATIPASVSRCR